MHFLAKNKKQLITLIASAFISTVALAQSQSGTCQPTNDKRKYQNFEATLLIDDVQTTKKMLTQYCFKAEDFSKHQVQQKTAYYARSKEMLELLAANFDILNAPGYSNMKLDTMMFYAIQPEIFYNTSTIAEDLKEIKKMYKESGNTNLDKLSDKELLDIYNERMVKNKEAMLDFLFELQATKGKPKATPNVDVNGNDLLHYLVVLGEAKYIEQVLKGYNSPILRKGRVLRTSTLVKLAPITLAFNIKTVHSDKEKQEALVAKINDLLLADLKHSKPFLAQIIYYNNNVFQLAEIMKDKNPDFYQKLKAMYPKENYVPFQPTETRKKYLEDSNLISIAKKMTH